MFRFPWQTISPPPSSADDWNGVVMGDFSKLLFAVTARAIILALLVWSIGYALGYALRLLGNRGSSSLGDSFPSFGNEGLPPSASKDPFFSEHGIVVDQPEYRREG